MTQQAAVLTGTASVETSSASAATRDRPDQRSGGRPRRWYLSSAGCAMVLIGCLVFMVPLIVLILTALQPENNIISNGPAAVPTSLTLSNFPAAWTTGDLGKYYVNSALILLVKVPVGIIVASLAAYPLTKFRFRARKFVLVLLLIGLGVPQVITLYPLLQISRFTHLDGSIWVLILPYLAFGMPFEILVMRGAFMNVPRELIEAARVDGARERRIWARVCMPLVLPAIASLAILDGVATWNEFVIALTLLNSQSNDTLPIGILNLQGQFSTNFAQLTAGVIICVIPMVVLFFLARRYLTKGVAAGAVKM